MKSGEDQEWAIRPAMWKPFWWVVGVTGMKDELQLGEGQEKNECTQFFCILLLKGTEKCAVPRGGGGVKRGILRWKIR